jgi:hypothetical protein
VTARVTLRIATVSGALTLALACGTRPPPAATHVTSTAASATNSPTNAKGPAPESVPPQPTDASRGGSTPVKEAPPSVTAGTSQGHPGLPEDPALWARLSATAHTPKRFANPRDKRFRTAHVFVARVTESLRKGSWRELKGNGCEGGMNDVAPSDAAAAVVDASANIKALTIFGGTDDHFHEVRFFYDDSGRLRVLFAKYADVHGGMTENILYFDEKEKLVVCDNLDLAGGRGGWDLCADESTDLKVDPEVESATRPRGQRIARNELREQLRAIDPRAAFQGCLIQKDLSGAIETPTVPSSAKEQKLAPSEETKGCFKYEPEEVLLRGVVEVATFPGAPNYTSIAHGDARETYWLLRLDRPVCVEGSELEGQAQSDVRRLQLVFHEGSSAYNKYRHLLGRGIEARGTLFGAQTGHHHTEVLLTVTGLSPRKSGAKEIP